MEKIESRLFKYFDYLDRIDSTNNYLKTFIGNKEPRMAVAKEQTAGKGRFDRSWYSPPEEGLYVSYLLYPHWNPDCSPYLTMISGLAVLHAIRESAPDKLSLSLKPPNDVLIEGKKVSGILTEMSSFPDRIVWAIIGIGVNLSQKEFPGDLNRTATSLELHGLEITHPLHFCDTLTKQLEYLYFQLENDEWEAIRKDYQGVIHEHF